MPLYLGKEMVSGISLGAPGKSAFEAAKEAGYAGTEQEFNHALKDVPGHIANEDNPHGVTAAQVGARPDTWMPSASDVGAYSKTETDTLLQKKVNTNLLDNWYFGNAVNQRGAEGSITINRYFIDRWLYTNGDSASSLIFNDGVVTLNGNTGYCALRQVFETPKSVFIGKRMTISALTTELGLVSHTFTCLDGVENFKNFSDAGSYIVFDTRADNVFFTFVANMETISVIACKVEFGDQQTLAHQDENGNWVLNEIPDYGEQLARCQRYFQTFAAESLRPTNALDFRPIMRKNPSLSTITVDGKTLYTASADL